MILLISKITKVPSLHVGRYTLSKWHFAPHSPIGITSMAGHEILQPGGFLPPTLPSPPTSSASATASVLPHPRFNPLKPGGAKESSFIDYVDRKLLAISRRYEKRFNADFDNESSSSEPEGRGYETFDEMAQELDSTIDIVWVSGTRTRTLSILPP